MKKHIPNIVTLGNLMCGTLAIFNLWQDNAFAYKTGLDINWTVAWMFIGGFLDVLDGAVARLLRVNSALGKQLDSLADLITFGVVPALLLANVVVASHAYRFEQTWAMDVSLFAIFLLPVASGLRLARFNIDPRQANVFIGLPTPANALLVGSIILSLEHGTWAADAAICVSPFSVTLLALGLSFLLNSPLRLMAFKFKAGIHWRRHWPQLGFLASSAVLLAFLGPLAGLPMLLLYVVFSICGHKLIK